MIINERHLGNGTYTITFTDQEMIGITAGMLAGAANSSASPASVRIYLTLHDELVAQANMAGAGL